MKTLFDQEVKKLHHADDPETSKVATRKTVKKLHAQQQEVLNAIWEHYRNSDFTAKELAMTMARNFTRNYQYYYYMVSRRLGELGDNIERTGEARDGCSVWRLK
jgi:hypothetical protein